MADCMLLLSAHAALDHEPSLRRSVSARDRAAAPEIRVSSSVVDLVKKRKIRASRPCPCF